MVLDLITPTCSGLGSLAAPAASSLIAAGRPQRTPRVTASGSSGSRVAVVCSVILSRRASHAIGRGSKSASEAEWRSSLAGQARASHLGSMPAATWNQALSDQDFRIYCKNAL